MKRIAIISLLAALAICGCQVNEPGELTNETKIDKEARVFTAIIEDSDSPQTKTSLDDYGNVLWKQGDQVSIFAGSTINERYQVTDESDSKTAASLVKVAGQGFVAGTDIDNNVAYYPYSANVSILKNGDDYLLGNITLPATQTYEVGSFGPGDFPMAAVTAYTEDLRLKFKNVLGGLKLQLKGTAKIASVSITGNGDEILCGAAEVTVANGTIPTISLSDATARTVTLDCGEGVQLFEETEIPFVIALPPMTMEGGFTVTVTDTQGRQMEIKTTRPQTITRSRLLKMPAVTYEGTMPATEHVYVDLNLPSGLKWATCNLGADAPEEYGDYFAWGETQPYYSSRSPLTWKEGKSAGYAWASYQWCGGAANTLTKYNIDSSFGPDVDNKVILEAADDAASASWGGSWRLPTYEEWEELLATKENTTDYQWELKTIGGHQGWEIKCLANDNSIFIPIAGSLSGDVLAGGSAYWSSSLMLGGFGGMLPADPNWAWATALEDSYCLNFPLYRLIGGSIRPVTDEGVRVAVAGISLDESSLELEVGATATINSTVSPAGATQKAVVWSSSDTDVATVDYTGKVTAAGAGTATITATTYDGGLTGTCAVTVVQTTGTLNGYDWVDLGLPSGLKWAAYNIGATAPEEYGDYFAWGETQPYYSSRSPFTWKEGKSAGYAWASYQFRTEGDNWDNVKFSKYNFDSEYGPVDNKTTLEIADDAARANWGGSWRMPTDAEYNELKNNCTCTWTTQNGVTGELVQGPNGNCIFLPAYGGMAGTGYFNTSYSGWYWTSSLEVTRSPNSAIVMWLHSDGFYTYYRDRFEGFFVRPVTD